MDRNRIIHIGLALIMLLLLTASPALSQEGGEEPQNPEESDEVEAVISPLITYQGRLVEDGMPVTGNRSMTFRLYTASSGGGLIWSDGPDTVHVEHGLFSVALGSGTPLPINDMDQALWIEIQVGATTLPRQRLTGAPYALSLAPGADITSDESSGTALYVRDTGDDTGVYAESTTGHGLYATSDGVGSTGAAVWAQSTDPAGIAMWGQTTSTDATLVLGNNGGGHLIKAFGNDGGEDEFRLDIAGRIETKADTYWFVPACGAAEVWPGSSGVTLGCYDRGSVDVNATSTGIKHVILGVTLPGVLFGQPVKIEEVTIYYRTSNVASFVDEIWINRINTDHSTLQIAHTTTDYLSTFYTTIPIPATANNVLDANTGFVAVQIAFNFTNTAHEFILGGIRLRLGHHSLY